MAERRKRSRAPGAGRPFRVLLVCAGNTCRSPMAEAILRTLVPDRLRERVEIRSAGVGARCGMPASAQARKVAGARGVSLESFRSARLTRSMVTEADLVLTMDRGQRAAVVKLVSGAEGKTHVLRAFAADLPPDEGEPIADPLGGDARLYRSAFHELKVALEGSLPRLEALLEPAARPARGGGSRKGRS